MESNPFAAPDVDAPPPQVIPPPAAVAEPTPWERRAEVGFLRGLRDTVKLSLSTPGDLFGRMDWSSTRGALGFFLLVYCVPSSIGLVLGYLITPAEAQLETARIALEPLGEQGVTILGWLEFLLSAKFLALSLASQPVTSILGLYVFAGLTHLCLRLLKRAHGGWPATLKAFVYSAGPCVLGVIPSYGGIIAVTWWTVLQVIALSRAHRITWQAALSAVVGMHLVVIVSVAVPGMILMVRWINAMMGDFGGDD